MTFKEDFFNRLDQFSASPFLFLGSGFSLRYLNTENWEDLLRKYSDEIGKPFEKYRSLANGDWAQVGSLLAHDYHEYWFSSEDNKEIRESTMDEMIHASSPLKVSVSEYLKEASENGIDGNHREEIDLLKQAKINGLITTNYDLLCEKIFPDYKVYKSQQELIFSSLQEVGEIYKIHGCCTEPNTIVLTKEDYTGFENKNAYLAAKLLTVFLEHPTIFMGYSISDSNMRGILTSVISCLNQSQINELSQRLFFVQFRKDHDDEPIIERYEFEMGGSILPLTRIIASNYKDIFEVLSGLYQKFPASILRKMKEHIYELVNTNDPTEKISVVDFDKDTDLEKVDVVIGVGIGNGAKTEKSYETFTRHDIAEDIIYDNKEFNAEELCKKTLPKIVKAKTWIPVCKYYNRIKNKDLVSNNIKVAATRDLSEWSNGNPYSYKEKLIKETYSSVDDIVCNNSHEKALLMILLLNPDDMDVKQLRSFLTENFHLKDTSTHSSYYMKLLCLLDRLENS